MRPRRDRAVREAVREVVDREVWGVVYLPCCPYDGETDTQADAQIRPYVW